MCDPTNKPSFHRPDVFHNVQLGQGKCFAASALVTLLPLFSGTSVDARLQDVTQKYKDYCTDTGLQNNGVYVRPLIQKPDKDACRIMNLNFKIPADMYVIYPGPRPITPASQEIHVPPYIQKISRDTLNFNSKHDVPQAHWSRGAVTTSICGFIESFCRRAAGVQGNETYELIASWILFLYMLCCDWVRVHVGYTPETSCCVVR